LLAGLAFGISWFVYKPPTSDDAPEPTENKTQETAEVNTQDNPAFHIGDEG